MLKKLCKACVYETVEHVIERKKSKFRKRKIHIYLAENQISCGYCVNKAEENQKYGCGQKLVSKK